MKTRLFILALFLLPLDAFAACVFDLGIENKPCKLQTAHQELYIDIFGKIKTSNITPAITLQLPNNFYLESATVEQYGADILLVASITDSEAGSAIVALIDADTNNIRWQVELLAFNPSSPLISPDAIYIAAFGSIFKIERKSGDIVWQHLNLYQRETQAFNSFQQPEKIGSKVIFRENKVSFAKYDGVQTIVVDSETGVILQK